MMKAFQNIIFSKMSKIILTYAFIIILLLIVVQLVKGFFLSGILEIELYTGLAAILFLLIGLFIGYRKKDPELNIIDVEDVNELDLSPREVEVLRYVALGMSNKEIAEKLFVSLNTIKTHLQNIYGKLGVQRRTQAIKVAREYKLISEKI